MFSKFVRLVLILLGFSPILFTLWLTEVITKYDKIGFFINLSSTTEVISGLGNFFSTNYLLLIFITLIIIARCLTALAIRTLSVGNFDAKQIKPADNNYFALFFSLLLPFSKIPFAGINDLVFIAGFIVISIFYALVVNDSYHFNLVLRIFLGYKNYEVQTRKEVTYLVLSKEPLIHVNQFTKYVALTNHMLINVS